MKSIEIDRTKQLKDQPNTGHNRWHPDIPPILEVVTGEEVVIQTHDSIGKREKGVTTLDDIIKIDFKAIHPLTGPIFVQGAQPGDLLEVEFLDITPEDWGFTFISSLGVLGDLCEGPYVAHWDIADGWATSPHLPGVHIPSAPFTGIAGVAPSHAQVRAWTERESAFVFRGGRAQLPDPEGAVPSRGPAAIEGLRTAPPRENGGNMDVKHLTKGAKLLLPVFVEGALFSTGDAHFAQGDGEVCMTALEIGATVVVRFQVLKGEAERRAIRSPRFLHQGYVPDQAWAKPTQFIATMGMPLKEDGFNDGGNLTLAARNATVEMVKVLQERGYSTEQAYVICSVAADLRISQAVDLPNVIVTALLPEAIFEK